MPWVTCFVMSCGFFCGFVCLFSFVVVVLVWFGFHYAQKEMEISGSGAVYKEKKVG